MGVVMPDAKDLQQRPLHAAYPKGGIGVSDPRPAGFRTDTKGGTASRTGADPHADADADNLGAV
jgi:hypothetical protein